MSDRETVRVRTWTLNTHNQCEKWITPKVDTNPARGLPWDVTVPVAALDDLIAEAERRVEDRERELATLMDDLLAANLSPDRSPLLDRARGERDEARRWLTRFIELRDGE